MQNRFRKEVQSVDQNSLHAFTVVAQLENMTKASEVLHISQSALSNIVEKLEAELGQPLFERRGKKLRLNDNGRLLASTVRKMEENSVDGMKALKAIQNTTGTITIGVVTENDSFFSLLADFRKLYPNISFRLVNQKPYIEDFLATESDFLVLPSTLKGDLPSITIARRGNLFVLMSSDHPLASKRILSFEDIRNERFAFAIGKSGKIEPVYARCLNEGFKPNVAFLYNDIQFQLEMVLQSGVITIAYNTFRQFRQNMSGIIAVPLACDDNFTTDIALAWRKDPINPLANLLSEYAKGYRITRPSPP